MKNFQFFTFGGFQLWGDLFYSCGWRIQQNFWSKKCRLLDAWNIRRFAGTYDECKAQFEVIKEAYELKDDVKELVVMMHGLSRTRCIFNKMAKELQADGFDTYLANYPSMRADIDHHVEQFKVLMLSSFVGKKLYFVTHSLGGIILRKLLNDPEIINAKFDIKRIVQIAPPNQGSQLSIMIGKVGLLRKIMGPSLADLNPENMIDFPKFPEEIEFGIISGYKDDDGVGYNRKLSGDNDGVVTVDETMLDGAKATYKIRTIHTFICANKSVIAAVKRFFTKGSFTVSRKTKK